MAESKENWIDKLVKTKPVRIFTLTVFKAQLFLKSHKLTDYQGSGFPGR